MSYRFRIQEVSGQAALSGLSYRPWFPGRESMLPFRIIDRVKFFVERQLVKGAGFQLLVAAAFIALIALFGGALMLPLGGDFGQVGDAIWWAFLRLTDPG